MVTAIDRRREQFHTHELLRSHVVARLRRTRWQDLRDLYQRAAAWYEAQDDPDAALHHSALACDVAGTEALVRARAIELLARGAFRSLEEPDRLLEARGEDHRARIVLALAALEHDELDRADDPRPGRRGRDRRRRRQPRHRPRRAADPSGASLVADRWTRGPRRCAIAPEVVTGAPLRTLALARARGYVSVTSEPDRARATREGPVTGRAARMALRRRAGQDRPGLAHAPATTSSWSRRARPGRDRSRDEPRLEALAVGTCGPGWCWPAPMSSVGARRPPSRTSTPPRTPGTARHPDVAVGARDPAWRRGPRHRPAARRMAAHAPRADGRRRPRPARLRRSPSPPSSSSTRPSVSAGPGRPARSPVPSPPGWWDRPRRRCSTRGCCG